MEALSPDMIDEKLANLIGTFDGWQDFPASTSRK
jgi:hypothetical protein